MANGDPTAWPEAREIFRRYIAQQRSSTLPAFRREDLPGLTRYTPLLPDLEGLVMFTDLPDTQIEAALSEQIAYFADLGRDFEWSVYDFDSPADLAARLERRGFQPDPIEAFMVFPTASHRSRPLRPGVRVERVTDPAQLAGVTAQQEAVWQRPMPWLTRSLTDAMPYTSIYLAYHDEVPAGVGWIRFRAGTDFAGLHGGSVLSGHRGYGLYSALFDVRAEEARQRGVPFLTVDAAPMSRPILVRQGFHLVCETRPWRLKFAASARPSS